jgi:plasmid stabilization system protein ParE
MSRNRLEYHQGAIADAKSAVAWYKKHSPKAASDFIEELRQAAETILLCQISGHQARTTPDAFCYGGFHFLSSIRCKNQ